MSRKSKLPIKWMMGILILLVLMAYQTHQASKNMGPRSGAYSSSPHNFFEFLADLFGWGNQNSPSGAAGNRNHGSNVNDPRAMRSGGTNDDDDQSLSMPGGDGGSGTQGSGSALHTAANAAESTTENSVDAAGKDASDNTGDNADNNSESNAIFNANINPDSNTEINAVSNAIDNAMDNSTINSQSNADNNADNNAHNGSGSNGDNSQSNSSDASGGNSSDNSGSGLNSGSGSNGNSGGGSGDNSGSGSSGSGNNSGDNSGNNSGTTFLNPSNFPTINPIPTDSQVSQSIARLNQKTESLNALVASREAMVVPVVQQAQASKFQTVDTQNIPAPSPNQPPADVEAKVQAKELTYH